MQQKKLIGIILTVLGIVGAIMTAVPYLDGRAYGYNEENVNTFGWISSGVLISGIILILVSASNRTAR